MRTRILTACIVAGAALVAALAAAAGSSAVHAATMVEYALL